MTHSQSAYDPLSAISIFFAWHIRSADLLKNQVPGQIRAAVNATAALWTRYTYKF